MTEYGKQLSGAVARAGLDAMGDPEDDEEEEEKKKNQEEDDDEDGDGEGEEEPMQFVTLNRHPCALE